jgi:hypothetical protein
MVKYLKFAGRNFTLSPLITPTEKLTVNVPCGARKQFMERDATVSMLEFIPIHET